MKGPELEGCRRAGGRAILFTLPDEVFVEGGGEK